MDRSRKPRSRSRASTSSIAPISMRRSRSQASTRWLALVTAVRGGMTRDASRALEAAFTEEWGRIVAGLIRRTGNWDLAEDCAQQAFAEAARRWPGGGVADDGRAQSSDRPAASRADARHPPTSVRRADRDRG